ncbi:endonuclease/exonuclease/phosphatase family protein [Anaeromyxobacter diazotrophicus]|uniref:Endonuclease/exonuclease/phosphatase domain-containing protein n=1 Tax=Anaeromyxobacter diazotrophicus TaxID=2590199 RepID=A0A7I9VJS5_9BACT|nr:endonuclease/exonuclease/phosphatase family protein [Anaeromyxobacter diazotrophicus]GEJ56247.1 hypothetical protein AMYX_09880 [Anaeromyxobacter diazotrophicus]
MLRATAASLLLLLACGPAPAAPPPPTRSVRLVTWNVHDLFDEADRTAPPGEADAVLGPAEVEAKLERVGAVLRRLDADAVVLQEVENLALLERLARGPLAGRGYRAALAEGHDPRGIDVGVLTRLPLLEYRSHLDERDPDGGFLWARDLAEVRLGGAAQALVLVGAHLVSRLDPASGARRARQAARAREVLLAAAERDPGALAVLLGDLNDLPGSWALAPLLGDGAIADLGAALAPAEGFTWVGGGAEERLDYALVRRSQAASVAAVAVAGGPEVAAASDHRPLVVDLWLDPLRPDR